MGRAMADRQAHIRWAQLPTEELEAFVDKHRFAHPLGKRSASLVKKIRFFHKVLGKRYEALRLIAGDTPIPF